MRCHQYVCQKSPDLSVIFQVVKWMFLIFLVRGIKEKLMVLPDDVEVYPGHMGMTTIGSERTRNPFL